MKNNEQSEFRELFSIIRQQAEVTAKQSANIDKQTANIDSVLAEVRGVAKDVSVLKNDIKNVRNDVEILKNEEEVKTKQAREIKSLVGKIVSRRLGVNENPAKRTMEEKIIDRKYRSMFSQALYTEVADKGHLASPYSATAKKDFIPAMKDIEEWYPREGVDGLKKRADENALARRIAQEQGY